MESNNHTARVDNRLVPSPEDAVRQYEEAGGHLTHFSGFGEDPLADDTVLTHQRDTEFHQRYANFDPFFHKLVNGDDTVFHDGLLFLSK